MIFCNWSKEDSENLASIAKSLEKIAEREQERSLIEGIPTQTSFMRRIRDHVKQRREEIKVHEPSSIAEEAMEEDIKTIQGIQNKVYAAEKAGNMPFFPEALLDEEELETL